MILEQIFLKEDDAAIEQIKAVAGLRLLRYPLPALQGLWREIDVFEYQDGASRSSFNQLLAQLLVDTRMRKTYEQGAVGGENRTCFRLYLPVKGWSAGGSYIVPEGVGWLSDIPNFGSLAVFCHACV